jgi:hypothetical protein
MVTGSCWSAWDIAVEVSFGLLQLGRRLSDSCMALHWGRSECSA